MSDATTDGKRTRPGRRPRPWWRPGARAVVEVAAIVAAAAGMAVVKDRGEFPRPMIRELRSGTAAEKAEALRGLSLFGRAGEEAVPALLGSLRDDPSPVVRRGSVFALAEIVAASEQVEPFSLEQLLAGKEGGGLDAVGDGTPPTAPHPAIEGVVSALARSVREDPDPTVRGEAIAALGPLLDAALSLRSPPEPPFGQPRPQEEPKPPEPAFAVEPWMREAAGVIVDRAGSDAAEESRQATAWAFVAPAAQVLLDDDRRDDALVRGGARAAQSPDTHLEVLLVRAAALAMRDDDDRRGAFLDAMARAMAQPRPQGAATPTAGKPSLPFFIPGPSRRPVLPDEHALPFWMTGPSAREVARHPEAVDAIFRLMAWDRMHWLAYSHSSGGSRVTPREAAVQDAVTAAGNRDGVNNSSPAHLVFWAIQDDPAILDVLAGRLEAGQWRPLLDMGANWERSPASGLDPDLRTGLPPDRAAKVAAALLDHLEGIPEGERYPRPRTLSVISYFVRGTGPDSEAQRRLDALARVMQDDPRDAERAMGHRLMESLTPVDGSSP